MERLLNGAFAPAAMLFSPECTYTKAPGMWAVPYGPHGLLPAFRREDTDCYRHMTSRFVQYCARVRGGCSPRPLLA
jgi:hypothetical protein